MYSTIFIVYSFQSDTVNNECTVYKTMDYIGKKWTVIILLELYKGSKNKKRYSEIKRNIPDITPKVLSSRLKELEKKGMITKKIDSSHFPVKCEYSLTKSGNDFIRIIKDIKHWSLKWKIENKVCEQLDCKYCTLYEK